MLKERQAAFNELTRRWNDTSILFYGWTPFKKQAEVLSSRAFIRALLGANRVGKTESIGYACVARCMGTDPALSRIEGKIILHSTPAKVWAVSLDKAVARGALLEKVSKFIPPGEADWVASKDEYHFRNGSILSFKSCDSGWQKFQGAEVDLVGNDEEPPDERIFNEEMMRVMSVNGRIIFSFTPMLGSLWLHDILFDPTSAGFLESDVFHRQIGMEENPYLPPNILERAKRRYFGDEYKIRVKGEYVVAMGNRVFDKDKILFQREYATKPILVGELIYDDTQGVYKLKRLPANVGRLSIFRRPLSGRQYAIGVDVGDGNPMGDFSPVQVLDCASLEQVAVWHGRIDPAALGHVVHSIGTYYHDALVAVESNKSGGATLSMLKTLGYPNLYAMPDHIKMSRLGSSLPSRSPGAEARPSSFGWKTTGTSKPIMINAIKYAIEHDQIRVNHTTTLMELMKYAYLKDRSIVTMHGLGALKGHDDLVESLAIALQAAKTVNVEIAQQKSSFSEITVGEMVNDDNTISYEQMSDDWGKKAEEADEFYLDLMD